MVFGSLSSHPAIRRCTLHATVLLTLSLITYQTDNYRSRFHCDTTLLRVFISVLTQNNLIVLKMEIVHFSETSKYLTTTWDGNATENYSLMNNRCRRLKALLLPCYKYAEWVGSMFGLFPLQTILSSNSQEYVKEICYFAQCFVYHFEISASYRSMNFIGLWLTFKI
jgi:hypothetical protein